MLFDIGKIERIKSCRASMFDSSEILHYLLKSYFCTWARRNFDGDEISVTDLPYEHPSVRE